MNIEILQLIEGAKQAKGLTVIIDVFRAFTTECFFMANGAKTILPVADAQTAYTLKKQNPGYILAGERDEVMLPGFDFGNSPANIQHIDFTGKTIIHTTSAGTQGIRHATNASQILTGSLANAPAIAQYIRRQNPQEVSLVCMGKAALCPTLEDTCCAEYIKSLLLDKPYPITEKITQLYNGEGKRFFHPQNQEQCPQEDFTLSTTIGRFPFVLVVQPPNNEYTTHHVKRIEV